MSTVEEAKAPDVFDVLSFVEQTAYPTENVTVFQDAKAVAEYAKLMQQRIENDKKQIDETEEFTSKLTAVVDKVRKSAIIFELRGLPPGIVNDIISPRDGEESTEGDRDNTLIAATIIGIYNAEGVKGTLVDAEGVKKLRNFLKEAEFSKLVQGVADVNFNAAVFDQTVDAGFPSGSDDLAGEL